MHIIALLAFASLPKPMFYATANVFVGPMAGRPVTADFNMDHRLDVMVACGPCCGSPTDPASGHVVVLRETAKAVSSGQAVRSK